MRKSIFAVFVHIYLRPRLFENIQLYLLSSDIEKNHWKRCSCGTGGTRNIMYKLDRAENKRRITLENIGEESSLMDSNESDDGKRSGVNLENKKSGDV